LEKGNSKVRVVNIEASFKEIMELTQHNLFDHKKKPSKFKLFLHENCIRECPLILEPEANGLKGK